MFESIQSKMLKEGARENGQRFSILLKDKHSKNYSENKRILEQFLVK